MSDHADQSETQAPRTIRFCVNNPRTLAERNALIEAGYECVGCLGNCSQCFETRFLEVGDRFIEGESYDEIIRCVDEQEQSPNTAPGMPAADDDARDA